MSGSLVYCHMKVHYHVKDVENWEIFLKFCDFSEKLNFIKYTAYMFEQIVQFFRNVRDCSIYHAAPQSQHLTSHLYPTSTG